jgi:hypothetical protein
LSDLAGKLAWPGVVVFIAWLFRASIRGFLNRIVNIRTAGLDVSAPTHQDVSSKAVLALTEQLEPNILRSSPVAHIEMAIRSDLDKVPEDRKMHLLLTALAQTRLESVFNLAYANIFGSQIKGLRHLVNQGGSATWQEVEREFEVLQSTMPTLSGWSVETYLKYLVNYRLIETDALGVKITDFGREFLAYLPRVGLSEDRMN